jgi:gliding motility-associated-like protein
MTRAFLWVFLFIFFPTLALGQCVNGPIVTLSSSAGTICGIKPVTLSGNTFGGTAKLVTFTSNGTGTFTPGSANKSPFSFTYAPKNGDLGKSVIITVTTNNPSGAPCVAAKATYTLSVNAIPSAPLVGTITTPTCLLATGSVVLNGLPSTGIWTLTRNPDTVITSGTGMSTTISDLVAGVYTYTVTNAAGCTSLPSSNITIPAQPASPSSPTCTIDCSQGIGKAVVIVTNPKGTGLTYSLDGGLFQSGTTFFYVPEGTHYITVRNTAGCTTTGAGFLVACGCVGSPTVTLTRNNAITCGTAPITVSGNTFGGSATNVTITDNGLGIIDPSTSGTTPFAFTYTPVSGDEGNTVLITVTTNNPLGLPCAAASAVFTLAVSQNPLPPVIGAITQPSCSIPSGSVELDGLPSTGSWTVTSTPGAIKTTGIGNSTVISGLASGTYFFTVTNSAGCISGASANVVINPQPAVPSAPVIGTVTQPTCSVSTGSAVLNGLPSTGTWTLTRSPGGVTAIGSGTSTTIMNLSQGVYTFTVTNSAQCISPSSSSINISAPPTIPTAPVVGTITAPTCSLATGSVVLTGLPATGTWTLTRYPGTITSGGIGTSITLSGLIGGTYNFSVASSAGCVSGLSANVIIPAQPEIPTPPLIGTITQPGIDSPTGSVVINGLPINGTWQLKLSPGNLTTTGSGSTIKISGLATGTYTFTVTNSAGCISASSAEFGIYSSTGPPVVVITNPAPVCFPSTVDLTDPKIVAGSTLNLIYSYWTDAAATIDYRTPSVATDGKYYIKGTTSDGFFAIKPVTVIVYRTPVANAGPDQVLSNVFITTMNAQLANNYETGIWSVISGSAEFSNDTLAKTNVTGLSVGKNMFLWTVTNKVCSISADTVLISVSNLIVPTLITPNMDGKNDYFILKGSEAEGRMEIVIFDRRGVQVYKNSNYDNSWNGVDYNGKPLSDDTYFYIVKTDNGPAAKGYVVVRR